MALKEYEQARLLLHKRVDAGLGRTRENGVIGCDQFTRVQLIQRECAIRNGEGTPTSNG